VFNVNAIVESTMNNMETIATTWNGRKQRDRCKINFVI